jgi:hypothetical protein
MVLPDSYGTDCALPRSSPTPTGTFDKTSTAIPVQERKPVIKQLLVPPTDAHGSLHKSWSLCRAGWCPPPVSSGSLRVPHGDREIPRVSGKSAAQLPAKLHDGAIEPS